MKGAVGTVMVFTCKQSFGGSLRYAGEKETSAHHPVPCQIAKQRWRFPHQCWRCVPGKFIVIPVYIYNVIAMSQISKNIESKSHLSEELTRLPGHWMARDARCWDLNLFPINMTKIIFTTSYQTEISYEKIKIKCFFQSMNNPDRAELQSRNFSNVTAPNLPVTNR
jgi:hypothetical protein